MLGQIRLSKDGKEQKLKMQDACSVWNVLRGLNIGQWTRWATFAYIGNRVIDGDWLKMQSNHPFFINKRCKSKWTFAIIPNNDLPFLSWLWPIDWYWFESYIDEFGIRARKENGWAGAHDRTVEMTVEINKKKSTKFEWMKMAAVIMIVTVSNEYGRVGRMAEEMPKRAYDRGRRRRRKRRRPKKREWAWWERAANGKIDWRAWWWSKRLDHELSWAEVRKQTTSSTAPTTKWRVSSEDEEEDDCFGHSRQRWMDLEDG